MLARAYSAAILGVEGYVVTVEAEVGLGLPGLTLVGRVSGALQEARDRVRAALSHCGHPIPPRRQIVNLAPADRRKDSPGIDLSIACALLAGHEVLPADRLADTLLWGELALDGTLRPAAGTLIVADCARAQGFRRVVVPACSVAEAALIPDLEVIAVPDLAALVAHLRDERPLAPVLSTEQCFVPRTGPDMADVRGLELARLGLEVMAAGGHNLLLHGPPGVGKTMLARRAAGLLPPLDALAALEVTKIHEIATRRVGDGLMREPPVRMPHHTVSAAGLLGGGSPVRPGEVSLSHRGLLFLDELPEFNRACLEGLREPLEDGEVSLVRASQRVRFPARFQLMAAMNPCPCGYLGHPERACVDSSRAIQRYQQRISGPFWDRIDLVVPVHPISATVLSDGSAAESTARLRERIGVATDRQAHRLRGTPWRRNAEIPADGGAIDELLVLDPKAERLLASLGDARRLSPRARHRMRRVARTIGDLCGDSDRLGAAAVAKAAHLRRLPELAQ